MLQRVGPGIFQRFKYSKEISIEIWIPTRNENALYLVLLAVASSISKYCANFNI